MTDTHHDHELSGILQTLVGCWISLARLRAATCRRGSDVGGWLDRHPLSK
jgi:hypothetical protein